MSDFPIGLVRNQTNAAYHSRADILSNSILGDILEAPAKYYGKHLDPERHAFAPEPKAPTSSQLHGTLAHCAILQPDLFDSFFVVGPTANRNTNEWKHFVRDNPDRVAIQEDQRRTAFAQSKSVRSNPKIAHQLSLGEAEVSAYWIDHRERVDEETGEVTDDSVHCRCRPDWVHDGGRGSGFLLDVKTYASASMRDFGLQVARSDYDRQAAWYSDGFEAAHAQSGSSFDVEGFVFVAVETEYPFLCSAYTLPQPWLQRGRVHYRTALAKYRQSRATNYWPSYTEGVQDLVVPGWVEKEVAKD